MFIFNTDLLLIDVTWTQGIIVAIAATIAILVFTAGTMGWFVTRSRIYESVALILVAFALFRPDFFMDRLQPPFQQIEPAGLSQALSDAKDGDALRLVVNGPDFDTGEPKDTTLVLDVQGEGTGAERLEAFGLMLIDEEGITKLDEPLFGTPFSDTLSSFDFYGDTPVKIASVQAPSSQMAKEVIFLPALLLLALIAFLQKARLNRQGEPA